MFPECQQPVLLPMAGNINGQNTEHWHWPDQQRAGDRTQLFTAAGTLVSVLATEETWPGQERNSLLIGQHKNNQRFHWLTH